MEDVLWHSATSLLSKSILVKIPRLPTIRGIGSQFISTSFLDLPGAPDFGAATVVVIAVAPCCSEGLGEVAGGQLGPRMAPLGFLVHRRIGERSECPDGLAVQLNAG